MSQSENQELETADDIFVADPEGETTKRIFQNEIRQMLYGFGDARQPRRDTAELLEDLLREYLTAVVQRCIETANTRGRKYPDVSDLRFLLRKDLRKLRRVNYLVAMKEVIDETTRRGGELESLGR
jgi:transcription initiation factor TFIID subunit 13